ncbi:MerR family transcriptional regulator [Actinokineospora bangkokensis]|uniref:HTH merR-type domain-containing protein n=1 Tax=Actinokineospora bangkokensis TaxID=1193682 RepID=A0A1Q9LFE6_9PSEU|nr:MerR family transcriptional regulator [Actinokineospora bangkokensis]OLR90767.1 hypothetical protein BJP25_29720 [Actinokineospora bangkokensis]
MAWTIQQVARMSGVTSRTLRHYDEIGLLPPSRVGANGYRYYEQEQVLRLQRILLLRQLGMGLDGIAAVLSEQTDALTALRRHRDELLAERLRFEKLIETVTRTIEDVERGDEMSAGSTAHWFTGLDQRTQEQYQREARERWGERAVDAAAERGGWSEDKARAWGALLERFVELIDAGLEPGDPRVQGAVADHHAWLTGHWTPDRESYQGLADVYADDPRFREKFDRTDPRLAEFLRTAMRAWALDNLG